MIKEEIPQIETEVRAFSSDLLPSIADVPNATRHHYERCAQQDMTPFTFAFVPHILFRGTLEIKALRVIEGDEDPVRR